MTERKTYHTPGDWEVRGKMAPGDTGGLDIHGDGVWIGSVLGNHRGPGERQSSGFPGNGEANANGLLFAAAPKLLAAAERAVEALSEVSDCEAVYKSQIDQLKEAILLTIEEPEHQAEDTETARIPGKDDYTVSVDNVADGDQ